MNNLKNILVVTLLVSSAAVVARENVRAVVDVEKVATTANYFKDKQVSIKIKLDPEAKEIEKMGKEFQAKVADFQSKASTMSDVKKQEEIQVLARSEQELKMKQESFQKKAQTILAEVQKELIDMIAKISEKLGFTEVDHKQGKVYVHKSLDKTDQIIAELNKTTKSDATKRNVA